MILLDTHVFWKLARARPLGKAATRLLNASAERGELRVSPITWWELQMLSFSGRIRLTGELRDFRRGAQVSGFVEIPIDGEIGILAASLQGLHKDPADRFLVATALSTRATLVTEDNAILELKNGPRVVDASE
jgi:PIN domain nuclease of toxin-antitoxin system